MNLKHTLLAAAAALLAPAAPLLAQNLQVHYDLGHSLWPGQLSQRPSMTTTAELYKPDRWGSTFFFIDLDYYTNGVAGAYWEVAREFTLKRLPTASSHQDIALHAEYDGGVGTSKDLLRDTRYQQAVLAGPAWNLASDDYQQTLSLQLLYKYFFKGQHAYQRPFSSVQLTAVWGLHFARKRFSFTGYFDLWYDQAVNGNWILQGEPQFWVNLNTLPGWDGINLSVGGEVEISNNFVFTDKGQNNRFFAIPTLALKYTF